MVVRPPMLLGRPVTCRVDRQPIQKLGQAASRKRASGTRLQSWPIDSSARPPSMLNARPDRGPTRPAEGSKQNFPFPFDYFSISTDAPIERPPSRYSGPRSIPGVAQTKSRP
jgi:hypothetical protein